MLIGIIMHCSDCSSRGSFIFWNEASHARAVGVLQPDGTDGTVSAAVSEGKCSSKIER